MGNILTKNGYVIYKSDWNTDRQKNYYWEKIRKDKEADVKNLLNEFNTKNEDRYEEIGLNLEQLGLQERNKEMQLIQQALGINIDPTDIKSFVDSFNSIMIGVDSYKKALDQITLAKQNFDETHKKSLAPVISSLFVSKFNKCFSDKLKIFIRNEGDNLLTENVKNWEEKLEKILDDSAEEALEQLLMKTPSKDKDIFGSYYQHLKEWQAYIEGGAFTRNKFLEIVKDKVNLDKIKTLIKTNLDEAKLKASEKTRGFYSLIQRTISTSSQTGQIGGSINEFINQLLQSSIPQDIEIRPHERAAMTFRNNMQKIDNALIISFDAKIDTQEIIETLDNNIMGATDLIDAEKLMSDYWENNLKNLKDSFIIFTSGKAYGLTNYSAKGFHNDEKRSIKELVEVFSKGITPMDQKRAEEFIEVVENAIPGAVLDSSQDGIKSILRDRIYESMAYLLFDDWVALGGEVEDKNAIHAFTLNGINVPLSLLLIGAGKAIRKASSYNKGAWFNVSVSYPKSVLYKSSEEYPKKTGTEEPDVFGAWETQRDSALNSIKFANHFLANFYSLVANEFKN